MNEPDKVKRIQVTLLKPLIQAGKERIKGDKINVTPQQKVRLEDGGYLAKKEGES